MKRLLIALMVLMFANAQALAQSSPGWATDFVPTALQWNNEFASKQDYLGAPPCLITGCNFQGKTTAIASATNAGFNIPTGTLPSTLVDGDMWVTTSGLFVRVNGVTVGPLGTGVVGTLAVGSGGTGQSSFTANLPLIGNGSSAVGQGTRSGNTTAFATVTGALVNGHCVSIDASGNLVDAGGACTTGGGGGTVASATIGQLAIYTAATTVGGLAGCNSGYIGTNGGGTISCQTTILAALQSTITQVGTIATGVWNGSVIPGQYGGTGVANTGFTFTMGGNVAFSGAFGFTGTLTALTAVTFPTSGTLMNQNGTSGGIPYYSSSTTVGTSSALSANNPVLGGGAGSSPISGTRTGNTTQFATSTGAQTNGNCVNIDANGNHVASGAPCQRVLLNTLTASNSANLSDTTSLTSTYSWYEIVFDNIVPQTNSTQCEIQVQVSATFQTSGYNGVYFVTSSNSSSVISGNQTSFIACTSTSSILNSGIGVSGVIRVYNPSAGLAHWDGHTSFMGVGPNYQGFDTQGYYATAGAVTGFRVLMNSGNIVSGTIKVYGNP